MGFPISAFENIRVLVSVMATEQMFGADDSVATRLSCCYLKDGTTYFGRSTITDTNAVHFRLRNVNLLKRSMKLENPLFVTYVFFLVKHQVRTARIVEFSADFSNNRVQGSNNLLQGRRSRSRHIAFEISRESYFLPYACYKYVIWPYDDF